MNQEEIVKQFEAFPKAIELSRKMGEKILPEFMEEEPHMILKAVCLFHATLIKTLVEAESVQKAAELSCEGIMKSIDILEEVLNGSMDKH